MIKILENIVSTKDISKIKKLLKQGHFTPGKDTAGWAAKSVKTNDQWHADSEYSDEVFSILSQALLSHPHFSAFTYAKDIAPFLISQSQKGNGYGSHVDDALMGHQHIMRSDLSCTIFLDSPDNYTGGELTIDMGTTTLKYKLPIGSAIIYPSTYLHRVEPVTEGSRLVAVTWLESYVRNAEQREILSDLDEARREVMKSQGKTTAFDKISKTHSNLLRLWSNT
ncbi:Fe2+-dependent dioxygenase [Marinomonas sp. 2405UD66-6]|uniref:Fe2+-dependent dioxygenase n=1 Tax=Marinomonas sp. 2405UD66-6 TaxID=3391834 RepID=UPI0039C8E1ED